MMLAYFFLLKSGFYYLFFIYIDFKFHTNIKATLRNGISHFNWIISSHSVLQAVIAKCFTGIKFLVLTTPSLSL